MDKLNGIFDTNGDGELDVSEEFMAYKSFEYATNEAPEEEGEEDPR